MEIKQDFGTWERMSMIGSGLGIGFGADGIHVSVQFESDTRHGLMRADLSQ